MVSVRGYLSALVDRKFMGQGVKVALLVGTVLFTINHGPALKAGMMTRQRWISALLTYLVPYSVNVHGQYTALAKRNLQDLP
jgi:hypothetical protein